MPWELTPEEKRLLEWRRTRHVQPPTPDQKQMAGRVGGHEVGDLILLAALEDLERQGNKVAEYLVPRLRARMGIAAPIVSYRRSSDGEPAPGS